MFSVFKILQLFSLLLAFHKNEIYCNPTDFKENVDGFMNAFDEAYSTEIFAPTEDVTVENEIFSEISAIEGEQPNDDEEANTVKEEPFVTENVFQPGSPVKHEINEDLVKMASKIVSSISPDLELINITEAETMVTDKVERSFSLYVAQRGCERDCSIACHIDVVSRGSEDSVTWHNCLETNEVPRIKRVAVGGFKQVDEAEARELAEIAAQTLDSIDADDAKRVVTQVIRAQKQLVNGILYHLTLEMALSDCKESEEKCQGKLADYNICKILMQRLFSGDAPHNAQVIKSECNPISQAKEYKKKEEKRSKRHVDGHETEKNSIVNHNFPMSKKSFSHDRVMGGRIRQDPNSDTIREISQFALAEIDSSSNSLNKQNIVRVVEAFSQVVAGVKYLLKMEIVETNCRKGSGQESRNCSPLNNRALQLCDVVVWDKPWENFRTVTKVNCSQVNSREKRALVGGRHPADVNDERVKEIAQFAVSQLDARSNSLNSQKLVEIKQAETQVVAGTNFFLKLQLVETNCRKATRANEVCNSLSEKPVQECDVVVYDRPWDKHRELTKADCKSLTTNPPSAARNRRAAGGAREVDPLASDVLEAARLSLNKIDMGSNSAFKHSLIRVIDSRVQIVAGKKYFLTIEIGESECLKNSKRENCSVKPDSLLERCTVVVWNRPWLNLNDVLNVSCARHQKGAMDAQNAINVPASMFEEFKRKYNKVYSSKEEHNKRFHIFRANLKKIKALQDTEQGTAIYGPNQFADLSGKEFRRQFLGLKPGQPPKPASHHMTSAHIPDVELPTNFDWRDHGAVTPVKNQGQCGSCWAFSVTGNVEGQWFLKHGKLLYLSEQELVDCDKRDDGCEGGYMTQAYEAIEELGGLETEAEYPYEAKDDSCKFNETEARATVTSSLNITSNETQMAQWLFKNGPISIGINANAMQFYMGGVSHPLKFLCSKDQLDHGVLIVGFGVHNYPLFHKSLPFWIVKNSWGLSWGEQGYYRVYRGDGTCGVNLMASSAVVG